MSGQEPNAVTVTSRTERRERRRSLSPRVQRRCRALAEAYFATEAGPPPHARLQWVVVELDDFLARIGSSQYAARTGFLLLAVLVPLFARTPRSLADIPLPNRIQALRRIEDGPFGGLVAATKMILSILYFEHPQAEDEIGFDGACLKEGDR